jgi:Cytochrome C oxidase, cbb3-type, subunit III
MQRKDQEDIMTRAKPSFVVACGIALTAGWVLAVYASGLSASELYLECCAQCHGKTGRGDGPSADGLPSRPRNFTDCKTMVGIPDGVLFKAIKQGGAAVGMQDSMPSWEAALDDAQIHELIQYIRQFCNPSANDRHRIESDIHKLNSETKDTAQGT